MPTDENLSETPMRGVGAEAFVGSNVLIGNTMEDEEWDCPEDHVTFAGPCTCEHEPEQHGWTGCDAEGCECEAHWEE